MKNKKWFLALFGFKDRWDFWARKRTTVNVNCYWHLCVHCRIYYSLEDVHVPSLRMTLMSRSIFTNSKPLLELQFQIRLLSFLLPKPFLLAVLPLVTVRQTSGFSLVLKLYQNLIPIRSFIILNHSIHKYSVF